MSVIGNVSDDSVEAEIERLETLIAASMQRCAKLGESMENYFTSHRFEDNPYDAEFAEESAKCDRLMKQLDKFRLSIIKKNPMMSAEKLAKMPPEVQLREAWRNFSIAFWCREYKIGDILPRSPSTKFVKEFVFPKKIWNACASTIAKQKYSEMEGGIWFVEEKITDWVKRALENVGVKLILIE